MSGEGSNLGGLGTVSPAESPPVPEAVGTLGTALLVMYLILCSIGLLYGLVQLWPTPAPAGAEPNALIPVFQLFGTIYITPEQQLLLIVALSGALGALVHALRSLYWYVGNRALVRSWAAMYVLLPFIGTTLALIFYLVIRGGFFSPQATVQQTSPFGFAALAGLVGMFSPQAVLKLKDVAETILTKPPAGKNAA